MTGLFHLFENFTVDQGVSFFAFALALSCAKDLVKKGLGVLVVIAVALWVLSMFQPNLYSVVLEWILKTGRTIVDALSKLIHA